MIFKEGDVVYFIPATTDLSELTVKVGKIVKDSKGLFIAYGSNCEYLNQAICKTNQMSSDVYKRLKSLLSKVI